MILIKRQNDHLKSQSVRLFVRVSDCESSTCEPTEETETKPKSIKLLPAKRAYLFVDVRALNSYLIVSVCVCVLYL